MADFGTIKPIILEEAEKMSLEHFMAKAFQTLSDESEERHGESHVLRLRNDYKVGRCNLRRSPDAAGVMEKMIEIELTIIAGFIRVGHGLYSAFETPGVTYGDCVSLGSHAIYDAMYTFDGSTRFTTYAYRCIKNRILTFVKNEESANGGGFSVKVKALRAKARKLMDDYHLTLERAIARLQSEDDLDEVVLDKLSASLKKRSRHGCPGSLMDDWEDRKEDPELEAMREVIKVTPLSPLERTVIEGKMMEGREFTETFRKTSEGRNPRTGKPFTRAWLSQVYLSACEKLQAAYNGEVHREAA